MPTTRQRRNTAYLNRLRHRNAGAGWGSDTEVAATWTGLAIDLDGSLEQRLRPDSFYVAYLDGLFARLRRLIEGNGHCRFSFLRFVRSNG
jgi:hypothetical protein